MTKKLLEETLTPAFYEADAMGHINNTVIPMWFEKTRTPLFEFFIPDLDPAKWNLILVKIEVDYFAQVAYEYTVTIKTGIQHIGNSSFIVRQEVWQKDKLCVRGQTTIVHFDYTKNKSQQIPAEIRNELEQYFWPID